MVKDSRIKVKVVHLQIISLVFYSLSLFRPIFFYVATSIGCRGSGRFMVTGQYYVNLQCTLYPIEFIAFWLAIVLLILYVLLSTFSTYWKEYIKKYRWIADLINLIIFLDLTQLLLFGDAHGSYQISEGYFYYLMGLCFQFGKYKTRDT